MRNSHLVSCLMMASAVVACAQNDPVDDIALAASLSYFCEPIQNTFEAQLEELQILECAVAEARAKWSGDQMAEFEELIYAHTKVDVCARGCSDDAPRGRLVLVDRSSFPVPADDLRKLIEDFKIPIRRCEERFTGLGIECSQ